MIHDFMSHSKHQRISNGLCGATHSTHTQTQRHGTHIAPPLNVRLEEKRYKWNEKNKLIESDAPYIRRFISFIYKNYYFEYAESRRIPFSILFLYTSPK